MSRTSAFVTVALAWLTGLLPVVAVATATRIGPVVLLVTSRHGVHVGDAVALAAGVGFASVVTGSLASQLRP